MASLKSICVSIAAAVTSCGLSFTAIYTVFVFYFQLVVAFSDLFVLSWEGLSIVGCLSSSLPKCGHLETYIYNGNGLIRGFICRWFLTGSGLYNNLMGAVSLPNS